MPRITPVAWTDPGAMPPQTADWTCSACSLAWMNRGLGIDLAQTEWTAVDYIGNPEQINADVGLVDGSGARLVGCLREQGAPAWNAWLTYDQTYQLAIRGPLLIGGQGWYHWVGVHGVRGPDLWVANSAPGWMGITDVLGEDAYYSLGPFAVVVVPLSVQFPPPPQA